METFAGAFLTAQEPVLLAGTSTEALLFHLFGACLWVWLWWGPTECLPVLQEAVTCLQWFQCVSPDREPGAEAAKYCRIKSCRKRWQGKAHLWGEKKSQIKWTGKEIALRAAKEIVCQTYYFSAEPISARFLNILSPSTPFLPHPQLYPLLLLHSPSLNSEETKGVQAGCFVVEGSRHS